MIQDRPLQYITLEDGCLKVCLTEYGITECCTVSSHHLIEGKRKQLRAAIATTAAKVYEQ